MEFDKEAEEKINIQNMKFFLMLVVTDSRWKWKNNSICISYEKHRGAGLLSSRRLQTKYLGLCH